MDALIIILGCSVLAIASANLGYTAGKVRGLKEESERRMSFLGSPEYSAMPVEQRIAVITTFEWLTSKM